MPFEFGGENENLALGKYLRKVRKKMGVTTAEAAEQIKIHEKFIILLEEDKKTGFPGPVYRELFLKSYADFLKVNLEETRLRLPEVQEDEDESAEEADDSSPELPVLPVSKRTGRLSPGSAGSRGRWWFLSITLSVLAIVVTVVLMTGNDDVEKRETNKLETISHVRDVQPPQIPDSLYLMVIGRKECWFDLQIDGDSVFTGIVRITDTLQFALQDSIYFKLGRADGVDAWINGQPLQLGREDDSSTANFRITRGSMAEFIDSTKLMQ